MYDTKTIIFHLKFTWGIVLVRFWIEMQYILIPTNVCVSGQCISTDWICDIYSIYLIRVYVGESREKSMIVLVNLYTNGVEIFVSSCFSVGFKRIFKKISLDKLKRLI